MSFPIFKPADILLPADIPTNRWCVVACDQFTSQPEYWNQAADLTACVPSTFSLIFPECWLEQADAAARIARIQQSMESYLAGGVFRELPGRYIYLERTLPSGAVRHGLIGALDLEQYACHPGETGKIRATEGTVPERIPPRMAVRRGAALELPHVMVLIDDPGRTVIEPLAGAADGLTAEYAGELMLGGGAVRGWSLSGTLAAQVDRALDTLSEKSEMLFAVGDGNHSLAAAKACFEELKKMQPRSVWENHPARYALVELVNIYDDALVFEPIHRIVFDSDRESLLAAMKTELGASGLRTADNAQQLYLLFGEEQRRVWLNAPTSPLAVGSLQKFLDGYLASSSGRVDYIHGDEELRALLRKNPGAIGFLLPPMPKESLFPGVLADGALPRKTFSMGLAQEKRYYMEARKIR